MLTARSRRLLTASLVLTAGLGLSACGTGVDAQTNAVYQPAIGANLHSGDVRLYNTVLVDNEDGSFTLSAGLLNDTKSDQTLAGYSVAPLGATGAGASGKASEALPVVLKPNQLYTIGKLGELVIKDADLEPGLYATLTLTFADAGDVTIEAPVVARGDEGLYDSVAKLPENEARGLAAENEAPNDVAAEGSEGAE